MHRLLNALREHRHFFMVVTLLTLVTTFPTIIYVFKADVFWLPTGGSRDVFIKFWDIWHWKLFAIGKAEFFYSEAIFSPRGVSLVYHPLFVLHAIAVNILSLVMSISNAYSLAYILSVVSSALAGYVFINHLLRDKWIALVGAVIFGFSPHVMVHSNWPEIGFVATLPLVVYCLHRGMTENSRKWMISAGALTGLTTFVTMYVYVCALMTLVGYTLVLAMQRWRNKSFWTNICLLTLVIIATSVWRIYPMMENSQNLKAALHRDPNTERHNDLISSFVNHGGILTGPLYESVLQLKMPAQGSDSSYLGYLPIVLIAYGFAHTATRRKMMPWFGLFLLFLSLRLGSILTVNGMAYTDVLLPKHYLEKLVPFMFEAFYVTQFFQIGVLLPLAVLSCYGILAFKSKRPGIGRPFLLILIFFVALDYYIPIKGNVIEDKQFAFLDWLSNEATDEFVLVNLPMGRKNSMTYGLYQALSGYPHAEGAISRTPDSAYDYIRSNFLLNTWHQQQPISCELVDRDEYRSGLAQLKADGFSHIVFHREFMDAELIKDSFRLTDPSYADQYVWIFRLNDLRESCTDQQSAHYSFTRAYADALKQRSILDNRHGIMLVFPPTIPAADHFLHYLHHFAGINRSVVTVTSDEQTKIQTRHSDIAMTISSSELEEYAALWLVNSPQDFDAEQAPAFQNWFAKRFHFCRRFQTDDSAVFDLYLRAGIPCSAMDEISAMEVQYDSGVRLHNVSYAVDEDLIRFYLAWTHTTWDKYAYSLQFFDEDGQKALQDDKVIRRRLLSAQEIDVSALAAGAYSVQLIVYDFETHASQGGNVTATSERLERELEIARIEL